MTAGTLPPLVIPQPVCDGPPTRMVTCGLSRVCFGGDTVSPTGSTCRPQERERKPSQGSKERPFAPFANWSVGKSARGSSCLRVEGGSAYCITAWGQEQKNHATARARSTGNEQNVSRGLQIRHAVEGILPPSPLPSRGIGCQVKVSPAVGGSPYTKLGLENEVQGHIHAPTQFQTFRNSRASHCQPSPPPAQCWRRRLCLVSRDSHRYTRPPIL